MRTALIAGLITGAATCWFSLPGALSNADFAYMCIGAARFDGGELLVTPYFPPGFPVLLWLVVQCGMTALTGGMLLAALGTALSAGALTYLARRFGLPAAPALALGILGVSLPDVFMIAFNPHVDALYTGLALVMIAAAFRLMADRPPPAAVIALAVCAVMLLVLRYHAVLVVIPVIAAVMCDRRATARRGAALALAVSLIALCWIGWSMYAAYGGYVSAATTQVATGRTYRSLQGSEQITIFQDYDGWLESIPVVTTADIFAGIRANWPLFLTRKAVLLGLVLWLTALAVRRSPPPGTILVPFILLYTLAASPTYFTLRASALTELAALALVASAFGALTGDGSRKQDQSRPVLNRGLAGVIVFLVALGGIAYNLYREVPLVDQWRARRELVRQVDTYIADTTPGGRMATYGSMDHTGWLLNRPYSLPGPTYTRYWMDDPLVAPQIDDWLPRTRPEDALAAGQPFTTVVLWNTEDNSTEQLLARQLDASASWREAESPVGRVRIWRQR